MLNKKGVKIINKHTIPEKGTVIIRAHGIRPELKNKLKRAGLNVVDATCPFVAKVQRIISKYARKGYYIIIVGDHGHAEVEGYQGYAREEGMVVSAPADLKMVPAKNKYCLVAQTTKDEQGFQEIVQGLKNKFSATEVTVHNTICGATRQRQQEALRLAGQVEAMIVVGGKNSANSIRLAQICEDSGCPTFFVEKKEEIPLAKLANYKTIGVTAGASTPQQVIEEVVEWIGNI